MRGEGRGPRAEVCGAGVGVATLAGCAAGVALVFVAMFLVAAARPDLTSRRAWRERHR